VSFSTIIAYVSPLPEGEGEEDGEAVTTTTTTTTTTRPTAGGFEGGMMTMTGGEEAVEGFEGEPQPQSLGELLGSLLDSAWGLLGPPDAEASAPMSARPAVQDKDVELEEEEEDPLAWLGEAPTARAHTFDPEEKDLPLSLAEDDGMPLPPMFLPVPTPAEGVEGPAREARDVDEVMGASPGVMVESASEVPQDQDFPTARPLAGLVVMAGALLGALLVLVVGAVVGARRREEARRPVVELDYSYSPYAPPSMPEAAHAYQPLLLPAQEGESVPVAVLA
jgi:hypothetical protein